MKRLVDDGLNFLTGKSAVRALSGVTDSNDLGHVAIFSREGDPKLVREIGEQVVELVLVEVPPD